MCLYKSGARYFLAVCLCLPLFAWSSEATVRVAFVYNFIKFIQWPDAAARRTLTLCAVDPAGDTLAALQQMEGKTAAQQVISLVYLPSDSLNAATLSQCQMVYFSANNKPRPLDIPLPPGVILVTDADAGNDGDAVIVLHKNPEGHIEFTINSDEAHRSGVVISSQLLKLARNIREK